jgi:hypothetical protein
MYILSAHVPDLAIFSLQGKESTQIPCSHAQARFTASCPRQSFCRRHRHSIERVDCVLASLFSPYVHCHTCPYMMTFELCMACQERPCSLLDMHDLWSLQSSSSKSVANYHSVLAPAMLCPDVQLRNFLPHDHYHQAEPSSTWHAEL